MSRTVRRHGWAREGGQRLQVADGRDCWSRPDGAHLAARLARKANRRKAKVEVQAYLT